ncbi:hypothetical protein EV385_2414 [Krasilnikovia cinnamomea]|uniref:Mce-associated membrane protein n=1 Tax=Krasilnikovia cinnamomea TaxID=349313 RepID=A0A4Q7ZKD3_9ACTN|nr:hypothetical protein [Krasilnikovia cinnamomea]RZU50639.1 hypothetical protein EV385_2414 [Krasilnikovia cinnamomea]
MQPPRLPDPPPAQPPGAVVAGGVPPRPRNRRLRLWLAMGAGIMLLLCLGGVGVFVSLYDSATEIKRSAPDAVVDGFLRAYLVNRDDKEAALYMCESGDFSAVSALRTELIKREQDFNVKVTVSWSTLTVAGAGQSRRSVATDLIISGTRNGTVQSRRTEPWSFGVVDEDGWRVCDSAKVV